MEFLIPPFPFFFGKGLRMEVPRREIESVINQGFRPSAGWHPRALASHTEGLLKAVDSGTII